METSVQNCQKQPLKDAMLLPCFYNAPISWYSLFYHTSEAVDIEICDHYSKQTYRNRCRIAGANGPIDLIIPVIKKHGSKVLMKDVRIDHDSPWQKIHWRGIMSAYASSPYFEFISDSYAPKYAQKYSFLYDLNLDLIATTSDLLNLSKEFRTSAEFSKQAASSAILSSIHPKRDFSYPGFSFKPVKYHQVFFDRYAFVEDLSILDLLFNEGPNSAAILSSSLINTE